MCHSLKAVPRAAVWLAAGSSEELQLLHHCSLGTTPLAWPREGFQVAFKAPFDASPLAHTVPRPVGGAGQHLRRGRTCEVTELCPELSWWHQLSSQPQPLSARLQQIP